MQKIKRKCFLRHLNSKKMVIFILVIPWVSSNVTCYYCPKSLFIHVRDHFCRVPQSNMTYYTTLTNLNINQSGRSIANRCVQWNCILEVQYRRIYMMDSNCLCTDLPFWILNYPFNAGKQKLYRLSNWKTKVNAAV